MASLSLVSRVVNDIFSSGVNDILSSAANDNLSSAANDILSSAVNDILSSAVNDILSSEDDAVMCFKINIFCNHWLDSIRTSHIMTFLFVYTVKKLIDENVNVLMAAVL